MDGCSNSKITKPVITDMKKLLLTGLLTLAMGMAAHAVSIQYANNPFNNIVFNGNGGFTFNTQLNSIHADTVAGTLQGEITGSFTIGAISGNTAPVSGPGQLILIDGSHTFTANLVWNDIIQSLSIGGLNAVASANLTGITYNGFNTDLLALKNALGGIATLSFQFQGETLAQLVGPSGPGLISSYSGSISTPDGGTTAVLLGFALAGIATVRRTIKGIRA
jgi:hypothetical protein